jgi:23S rRNA (cytosine1962-C5)-methyltransferase
MCWLPFGKSEIKFTKSSGSTLAINPVDLEFQKSPLQNHSGRIKEVKGKRMHLAPESQQKPLVLKLKKDLVRSIKRGHPWIYDDALETRPSAPPGCWAALKDKNNKIVAYGLYNSSSQLAFRVCILDKKDLHKDWVKARLINAKKQRGHIIDDPSTTAFRLVNGEGDGLPGLILDIYGDTAVMQVDGEAPANFWNQEGIAHWVAHNLNLQNVYLKPRRKEKSKGKALYGEIPEHEFVIQEKDAFYAVDVINGQKTGFFLDQRQNRLRIRNLAKNKTVLNVFGYTGGFSINAGLGGAAHVTTVDQSSGAIEASRRNWSLNNLNPSKHEGMVADAFNFFEQAHDNEKKWDITIVDPPSFASSKDTVKRAIDSYTRLFTAALELTQPGGLFCPASCSSHIPHTLFLEICTQAFSKTRCRGQVLGVHGQSEDHPYPLACPEMRYLKFAVFRLF